MHAVHLWHAVVVRVCMNLNAQAAVMLVCAKHHTVVQMHGAECSPPAADLHLLLLQTSGVRWLHAVAHGSMQQVVRCTCVVRRLSPVPAAGDPWRCSYLVGLTLRYTTL
jgi:hypothetical protein